MSRPRIELGSQELASCAITARPPQHDTTGARHRAFDVFRGSCYTSRARTTRQQGDPPFSPPLFSPMSDVTAAAITSGAAAPAADTDTDEENDDDAVTDELTVLPSFTPACAPSIRWGNLDGDDFCDAITAAYHEAVHRQRNIFLTPSGAEGKAFIQEMARLFQAYAEGSAMESFALTAAMTMPLLLLQKPHRLSKTKDHVACLKRRLTVWKSGDIDALLRECRAIQTSLRVSGNARVKASTENSVIRGFTKLMLLGNVRGALRVLSQAPPEEYTRCKLSLTSTESKDRCWIFSKSSTHSHLQKRAQTLSSTRAPLRFHHSTLYFLTRSREKPSAMRHCAQKALQDPQESTPLAGVACARPSTLHPHRCATPSPRWHAGCAQNTWTRPHFTH